MYFIFPQATVLRKLNLSVHPNEVIAIVSLFCALWYLEYLFLMNKTPCHYIQMAYHEAIVYLILSCMPLSGWS